jgi:large subunit ribosomal protein L9
VFNILSSKKEWIVKVIFLEDVPRVARVGQTRVVADGYARNYLFPRKLAVLANSQAAAAIDSQLKKKVKQRELEDAEMAELAKKIEGIEITLKAKVGESEKLYGSVTGADIAEALSKEAGCEIDKRKIDLPEPIKQTGSCDVTVRLAHEISAVIMVNVISEEAVTEAPAEAEKADEKKEKAPKKEKKEKPPAGEKVEAPPEKVKEEIPETPPEAVQEEKPAKKKKAKASKAVKGEAPAAEAPVAEGAAAETPAEEKKVKKTRAKAKKAEAPEEEKKES